MSERFRLPLPERIPARPSLTITILAAAIIVWGYFSTNKQPEGCYRVDAGNYLAIADNEVRLVSSHVPPESQSRIWIMEADRTRGYVLTLAERLVYDPGGPFGTIRTKEAPADEGTLTLVINELPDERPHALIRTDSGEAVRFFEFECEASAENPEAAG